MRQRDRESATGSDPQGLFFGSAEDDLHGDDMHIDDPRAEDSLLDGYGSVEADDGRLTRVSRRDERDERDDSRRSDRHTTARRRRNRRFVVVFGALFAAVVVIAAWLIVLPIYRYLHPSDYSGSGTDPVIVTVRADDGAGQIGTTLHARGVVASVRAFTNAAGSDAKSQNIQPGSYRLRKHMAALQALGLLLEPAARVNADVLVAEGVTTLDVEKRLIAAPCTATSSASATCGPGLSKSAVLRALHDVKALGLPTDYTVNGRAPSSAEGFLFPATYYFPSKTDAVAALQEMVSKFTDQARATDFTNEARALKITPYRELIIASIAQSEAKFAIDYPKVARVILNRLAAHKPLQIDATSAYAAKLQGLDPAKVIYNTIDSPYNTYTHSGLPPTPVGNPGTEAMNGAAHPSAGNALYYVNGDAQGHLFFTASQTEFAKAAAKCRANHWGCG